MGEEYLRCHNVAKVQDSMFCFQQGNLTQRLKNIRPSVKTRYDVSFIFLVYNNKFLKQGGLMLTLSSAERIEQNKKDFGLYFRQNSSEALLLFNHGLMTAAWILYREPVHLDDN